MRKYIYELLYRYRIFRDIGKYYQSAVISGYKKINTINSIDMCNNV